MAALLLLPLLLTALVPRLALSDVGVHPDPDPQSFDASAPPTLQDEPSTIALLKELEHAKKQLRTFEQSLSERDSSLQEKEKSIVSLQAQLQNHKKTEGGQLEASLKMAHTELKELEAKVSQLEVEVQMKDSELQEFKDRAKTLEAAEAQRSSKIKELEKLVTKQEDYIGTAEQALRAAEATLLKMQAEADVKDRELLEVHGGWLPPWTSGRIVEMQASTAEYWAKYAEPLIRTALEKASENAAALQEWSNPHVEIVKTHVQQKWNPVIKQSLKKASATISPHVETMKCKVSEGYKASKDLVLAQLENVQGNLRPYLQVARETCGPYVEEVAGLVRPHFERIETIVGPYTERAYKTYRSFLSSAATYHNELQGSVQGRLEKVDFLAPLASKELVWFLVSALLVLPVMAIFLIFCGPVKAARSHGGHGHKRAKRSKQAAK